MANTQNLDLVKPLGTDHALVSVLNSNSDKIDAYAGAVNASLDGLRDGLGILANGNTHAAITSGQYVYVKNHSSLPEGLYKATANIAANGTLSTSNLAADSAGGLNSLNEQIGTFGKVLYGDWVNVPSNTDTLQILQSFTITTTGVYMISGNLNYINTAPVMIEIYEPVNHGRMMSRYDNSEYLNANYTAVVEYFEAGQVVSVRGRWATNAAECKAHMTVIRIV